MKDFLDEKVTNEGWTYNEEGQIYTDLNGNKYVVGGKDTVISAGEIIYVTNAAELREIATQVNSGDRMRGKTIIQTQDIDLGGSSNPWIQIGTTEKPFEGIYDGNNKTITGLYIETAEGRQGLFGYIFPSATIKDLTISNADITLTDDGSYVGVLTGVNRGTVKNITILGGSVKGNSHMGGVVGQNAGTIQSCFSSATVESTAVGSGSGAGTGIGGIAGSTRNENTQNKIESCINIGSVTGKESTGGILGRLYAPAIIQSCVNKGAVSGFDDVSLSVGYAGGIVGRVYISINDIEVEILNCYNTGTIIGESKAQIGRNNWSRERS